MKNAIKVLCFTLAVIIVAVSSFLIYFKWDKTDFEYVDSTEKGEVIITAYKGDSKNIIIPSKIRGKKVTQIDSGSFEESDITSIEIGDNVTYIGKSAFRDCKSLKTVKLGKSILNIDEGAFNECSALEEIVLPKSLEKLGGSIFAGCTSLKKVTVEDGGNFVIKDGVLFSTDMKILYFALPYQDLGNYVCPDSVEEIKPLAFYECESLTVFTFSNKVKNVPQGAFVLCTQLKELTIPDSVTQLGSALIAGSGVKKITIPASVKVIDDSAFIKTDGTVDSSLVIRTPSGAKAETYAKEKNIKLEIIK